MMTNSDRIAMTDGVDCGGTACLDARAVERFCSELEQVRLIVVRASQRLKAQWPGLPADGTPGNAQADTDAPQASPPSDGGGVTVTV